MVAWYIHLHENHKNQLYVGKYTSPMDPMLKGGHWSFPGLLGCWKLKFQPKNHGPGMSTNWGLEIQNFILRFQAESNIPPVNFEGPSPFADF